MANASATLIVEDLGLVEYSRALELQNEAVELVSRSADSPQDSVEKILFCSHPAVVTLGRGTKAGDVFAWQGPTLEIGRGGRATYHGPSQIVAYPILNINVDHVGFKARDIHGYMRALEFAMCETLLEFGIAGPRPGDRTEGDEPSNTGVWIGDKKIASVGIGVRKGVTFHGLALNVENDPTAFQGINPCGFRTEQMTSMESELGRKIDRVEVQSRLQQCLVHALSQIKSA